VHVEDDGLASLTGEFPERVAGPDVTHAADGVGGLDRLRDEFVDD